MAKKPDNVNVEKAGRAGRKRRAAGWTLLAFGVGVAGFVGWWAIMGIPWLYELVEPLLRRPIGTFAGWGLLLLPVVLAIVGLLLNRSGVRASSEADRNACGACGYSLAGLAADAPCPECGKTKTGLG